MSLIFIAMPTKGSVLNNNIRPTVLAHIAALHLLYPQHTFIAPMVQDYQLLPYMPQTQATWEDWGKHCRTLIERCDEVWVIQCEGWDTSVGVKGEVEHARLHDKPIAHLSFGEQFLSPPVSDAP
jgi:hypothetical protein